MPKDGTLLHLGTAVIGLITEIMEYIDVLKFKNSKSSYFVQARLRYKSLISEESSDT